MQLKEVHFQKCFIFTRKKIFQILTINFLSNMKNMKDSLVGHASDVCGKVYWRLYEEG